MRLALLVLVLISAPVEAQTARDSTRWNRAGALTFLASVNGSLTNPQLGDFGVRYFATDRTAVGAALNLFGSFTDESQDDPNPPTQVVEQSSRAVSARLWGERHLGPRRGTVSPLTGLGLTASSQRATRREEVTFCDSGVCQPPLTQEQTWSSFSIGSDVFAGAEVAVTRAITLGAAYVVGVEFGEGTQEVASAGQPGRTRSQSTWQLRGRFTPITLSVRL